MAGQHNYFGDFDMMDQFDAPMNMANAGPASYVHSSHDDTAQSQYGSMYMDTTMASTMDGSIDPFGFPDSNPAFDASLLSMDTSPISPLLTETLVEEDYTSMPGMPINTFNSNAHAGPWMAIPRSDPTDMASLQIPGQPKYQFMQSISSSYDSGYMTRAPHDTPSLASAPAAFTASIASDGSDPPERPIKKIKKDWICREPGSHKTRHFANIHDLNRHKRTTHGINSVDTKANYYQCTLHECRDKDKIWDRKDNFRSHLHRRHFGNRNDDQTKALLDDQVARCEVQLTDAALSALHRKKQEAKKRSQETARKREERRLSRHNSNASRDKGKGRKRAVSGASSIASPIEPEQPINSLDSIDDHSTMMMFGNVLEDLEIHPALTPTSAPQYDQSANLQVPVSGGWIYDAQQTAGSASSHNHGSDFW